MIRKCQVHIHGDHSFFHYVLMYYYGMKYIIYWMMLDARNLFHNSCVQYLCGTKLKLYFRIFTMKVKEPEFGDYFTEKEKLECVTSHFQNFKLNRIFRTSKAKKKKKNNAKRGKMRMEAPRQIYNGDDDVEKKNHIILSIDLYNGEGDITRGLVGTMFGESINFFIRFDYFIFHSRFRLHAHMAHGFMPHLAWLWYVYFQMHI